MGGTLAIAALFTEYKLCKIIGIYTTKLTNKPINVMEKVNYRFGGDADKMYRSMVYKLWLTIHMNFFTQSKIASDLKIDPGNLSKMLTGVTEMSLGTFCAINCWLSNHLAENMSNYQSEYDKLCK